MQKEKVGYSEFEEKILSAIPKDGRKINTLELVDKVYESKRTPRFARQSIMNSANILIQKTDENEEPFEIFKSTQRGSQPIYFWIEPRERKDAQTK